MDEYGDMDIQVFSTKVYPVVEQFHEGFEGGYDAGWYTAFGSEVKVSDGVLELWRETTGTSVFERAMVVDLWDIRIRGAQSYDSTWVGVVVGGSDWQDPWRRFVLPHLVVGKGDPEFNIGLFIFDLYAGSFVSQPSWRAKVPSIESDEFVDFGIRAFDGKYIVSVNGEDVIEVDDSEIYSPTTAFVSLIGYPWVFAESEGFSDAVYFDEFAIAGVSSSTPEGQSRTPDMLWGQLPIEERTCDPMRGLLVALILAVAACEAEPIPTKLAIEPATVEIWQDETVQFEAVVYDQNGEVYNEPLDIMWESGAPNIAEISDGLVTPQGWGPGARLRNRGRSGSGMRE